VDASELGFLYAIPVGSSTGMKTGAVQQLSLAGIMPRQMIISPDNTEIFVALVISRTEVVPFNAINTDPLSTTGRTLIAVKSAGGAALSAVVDPSNRLFYIGETLGISTSTSANTGAFRVFSYSSLSGTLTEITGSPFAGGGLTPISILPAASGTYVYVANATASSSCNGSITGFAVSVNGSSYSLTKVGGSPSVGVTPAAWQKIPRGLLCF
jgi:hypothetical protein